MYRIALCEDCDEDRFQTKAALSQIMTEENAAYSITDFWSGEEFIFHNKPYMFDIVLFDVKMRRVSGIDAAKQLRESDRSVVIIFLTTFPNFVFSSFSAEPIQYLMKPLDYSEFKQTMIKAMQKVDENSQCCFCMSFGSATYRVFVKDIHYFCSVGRTVEAHCTSDNYSFYAKLDDVEKNENLSDFLRCHQSILVNPDYIRRISKEEITLFSGEKLPISRNRAKAIRDSFLQRVSSMTI